MLLTAEPSLLTVSLQGLEVDCLVTPPVQVRVRAGLELGGGGGTKEEGP